MTSSTKRFSGVSSTLAVLIAVATAWALAHLAFDGLAAYAEEHRDAYLWQEEDYLRVITPAYHQARGRGRLLIYGPSETRGLHPESMDLGTLPLQPYQNAQNWATFEDGLVVLNYLELAYGPSGLPDAVVLGVTPRFLGNIRRVPSPLVEAIKNYSPHFTVDEREHPPRLVPRSLVGGAIARARLLRLQPDRYRRGIVAMADPILRWAAPDLADRARFATRPVKHQEGRLLPAEALRNTLVSRDWRSSRTWSIAADVGHSREQMGLFRQFLATRDIDLYVVNLPEHSWNRDLYDPTWYASYLSMVLDALGPVPFLDLRAFLHDDEFYDEAHATWSGGERLSREVARWVRQVQSTGAEGRAW